MSYEPPFNITPQILNAVARISEQVGAMGRDHWESQPQLRRQNRIKTIAGTLAIEGSTCSEEQVTAIFDGKRVLGNALELAEVQGAIKAYESVASLDPFKLDDLLTPDGNGRMGRLWQMRLLAEWSPLFLALPLESVIRDNQEGYYEALASSDQQGDSTRFITFMLEVIQDTLVKNAPVNAPVNVPVNLKELKTPQAVLACIQQDHMMTRQEMAKRIGKDIRTIARAIKLLQESGRLTRVGSDKTGHWEMNDEL